MRQAARGHHLPVPAVHGTLEAERPLPRQRVDEILKGDGRLSHLSQLHSLVLQYDEFARRYRLKKVPRVQGFFKVVHGDFAET